MVVRIGRHLASAGIGETCACDGTEALCVQESQVSAMSIDWVLEIAGVPYLNVFW